jgi:hypothetical protein
VRTRFDSLLAGSLVGLAAAAQLSAQNTGTLAGRVVTADGSPIPHAQIAVQGTSLATVASVDGGFRLLGVPSWSQTLNVRMIGYKPRAMAFEVLAGDTVNLRVVLNAIPLPLDAVEVRSYAAVTPGMRGFEERRARGGPGVFLTRDDIERMQPRVLTDVFRRVPGLQVRPVRGGLWNNLLVQARGSECPIRFYMNGSAFPLPPDQPINDFVAPEDVVAMEVYSGSSEIPAQFSFNTRCGVIMLWTRYGPGRGGGR